MSKKLDKLVVCTDSMKVVNLVKKYKQDCYLTSKNAKNGTDRISIFLKKNQRKFKNLKLVVDIQCDEIFLNPKYQPWETLLQWLEIKIFLSPLLRVDGQWCYQDLSSHGGSHHCYTVYYILCQNCSQSHAMNNAKDIGREGAQKDCYSQQCADSTPEK